MSPASARNALNGLAVRGHGEEGLGPACPGPEVAGIGNLWNIKYLDNYIIYTILYIIRFNNIDKI
ncbi:MAG: hypothetical protein LBF40_01875 [Deltaproteobacteria bacterium]|nr:hypothetical protein [Deltaproteobacteria bacterium]